MNIQELLAPFPASDIRWPVVRKSEDPTKAYVRPLVDPAAVQARLDSALGVQGWRNTFTDIIVGDKLIAVRCTLGVLVDGQWVDKQDAAALSESPEHAPGTALLLCQNDALRRAALLWGVGRYLSQVDPTLVEVNAKDKPTRVPELPAHLLPVSAGTASAPAAPTRKPSRAPTTAAAEDTTAESSADKQKPVPDVAVAAQAGSADPGEVAPASDSAEASQAALVPSENAAAVQHEATQDAAATLYTDEEIAQLEEKARGYVASIQVHLRKRTSLANIKGYINGPKMVAALPKDVRERLTAVADSLMGKGEMSTA